MLIETHDTAMLLNELATVRGQLEQCRRILRNAKHVLEALHHVDADEKKHCKACLLYHDVVKALNESPAEVQRERIETT